MNDILIMDSTLRDGNHAVSHSLSAHSIESYALAAEKARIPFLEVGHGLGIGASSLQSGFSLLTDNEMLNIALKNTNMTQIQCFVLPGVATINKDIKPAIDMGVKCFRIGVHCTEATLSKQHVTFLKKNGFKTFVSLMMMHMASKEVLFIQCKILESYGVDGIIFMDSAGASLPNEIEEKIGFLVSRLNTPIGFHGHDNLGLSISNAMAAVSAGATIVDGTAAGFGAGSGNTQLEVIVALLHKLGFNTGIDLYNLFDASKVARDKLIKDIPIRDSFNIISGISGVCSALTKHIERISKEYKVDSKDVCIELGKRKAVSGQEDLIVDVASKIAKSRNI